MRFPSGLGVKLALLVSLLGLGGFLAATALADHNPERPFAGNWATSFEEAPASGTISWRFVGDAEGQAALAAIPGSSVCAEPSDYYVGRFTRGSDSGPVAACTVTSNGVTYLLGSYHSDGFGLDDGLTFVLKSATTFAGYYNTTSGQNRSWSGTFAGHFDGDGSAPATSTSQTSTGGTTTGTTTGETPTSCAAGGPTTRSNAEAEACLELVTWSVTVSGEPTSGPVSLDLATSKLAGEGTVTFDTTCERLYPCITDLSGTIRHGDRYVIADDERLKMSVEAARYVLGNLTLVLNVVKSDDPGCKIGSSGRLVLRDGGDRDVAALTICGRRNHHHTWVNRPKKGVHVDVDIKVSAR